MLGVVAQDYKKDESGFKSGVFILFFPGIGTWRLSIVVLSDYFMKIPLSGSIEKDNILDLLMVWTISVNLSTAYRLLFTALLVN